MPPPDTNGNGVGNGTGTTIVGTRPSFLMGGRLPSAEADKNYLAGGGGPFPLWGQVALTRGGDDLSRDLGMAVYDAMLYDPTVWSCFSYLAMGILAGGMRIVPALSDDSGATPDPATAEGKDRARAEGYAKFCQRAADRLEKSPAQVSYDLLFAMVYGCKLAEKLYGPGDDEDADKVVLKALKVKPNAAWSFVVDPFGDVVAIRGLTYGGGLADLPPEKFAVLTWMPRDRDPRGRSLFRAAYNGWNLKVNTWPKYFKYLDRFGTPCTIGTAAPDAPDEEARDDKGNVLPGQYLTPTEAMLQMLARLEGGSYAALRAGSTVQVFQATGNGEAFAAAIALFKREIIEGVLTSARTLLEAEHGSKADSQTSQDAAGLVLAHGRQALCDLWRGVFRDLIVLNEGPEAARLAPEVSFGNVEHQDVAAVAAGYAAIGYQADHTQFPGIDARLGLRVRDPAELAEQAEADRGGAVGPDDEPMPSPGGIGDGNGKPGPNGKGKMAGAPFSWSPDQPRDEHGKWVGVGGGRHRRPRRQRARKGRYHAHATYRALLKTHAAERVAHARSIRADRKDLGRRYRDERATQAKEHATAAREQGRDHAREHKELARDHARERRDLAKEQAKDRRDTAREIRAERAGLSPEGRAEARADHLALARATRESHAEARASLAEDHARAPADLREVHADERRRLHEDHAEARADLATTQRDERRDAAREHLESIRELHDRHRQERADTLRELLDEHDRRDLPAARFAADAATPESLLAAALEATGHADAYADGTIADADRRAVLHALAEQAADALRADAERWAGVGFAAGDAPPGAAGFFAGMRRHLRSLFAASALAMLGPGPLSGDDQADLRGATRVQVRYLDGFRKAVEAGAPPAGQRGFDTLANRAALYGHAAWGVGMGMLTARAVRDGATEALNVLGRAEAHCAECPELTARGWVPIASMPPIGSRECLVRCRCWIKTR